MIGGTAVRSGDILVGDKNGVAVVPGERVAEVVARLAAVAAKEAEMDEAIRAGAKSATWVQATIAAKGVRFVD